MMQDSLTLYKLIVLFMLDRLSFSLTIAQISEFILEREYTNYLTLQQAISEMTDAGLVVAQTTLNRTHLVITDDGRSTLGFFENRISDGIKEDIDKYFKENKLNLRNEVSIISNYYKSSVSGEFEAQLTAKDKDITLVDIKLSVPTEELASSICENWRKKNQTVYKLITEELF